MGVTMDSNLQTIMHHASDSDFYDTVTTLGGLFLLFLIVAVPCWLIFRRPRRGSNTLMADPGATLEMLDRARRLETRIEYLERVLDTEMPGWRTRS